MLKNGFVIPRRWALLTLLTLLVCGSPGRAQSFRQQLDSLQALQDNISYPAAMTRAADSVRRQLEQLRRTSGEQAPATIAALEKLSDLYQVMYQKKDAEPLLRQLVTYRQSHPGPQSRAYARALRSLSLVLVYTEHFAEAQQLNQQALTLLKQQVGERDAEYRRALGEEAFIWMQQGLDRDPSNFHSQVNRAPGRSGSGPYVDYVEMLDFLADWYNKSDWLEHIDSLNTRLLPILRKQVGERHPRYVAVLERMGDVQRDLRQYAAAEKLYRQVIEQRKRLVGPRHPDYGRVLYSLGFVCEATKRYAEAAPLYQEAVDILNGKVKGFDESYYCTFKMYALVAVYRYLGRTADALRAQQLVLSGWEAQLAQDPANSELSNQKEAARSTLYTLLASLPPADPALAATGIYYDRLLTSRGRQMAAAVDLRRLAAGSTDTAIAQRYIRWQRARQQVAWASTFTTWQQRQRGLHLERSIKKASLLENELRAQLTANSRAAAPPLSWRQVQQQLRPGEVALELVRFNWNVLPKPDTMTFRQFNRYVYAEDNMQITGPAAYVAYLVSPTSRVPELVVLRNGDALENEYRNAYRRYARTPGLQHRGAVAVTDSSASPIDAPALYTALWQPIARAMPAGTHTVFYSPDGVYHEVNPATLLNPTTGKPLLTELDVRLVGSTRELLHRATLEAPTLVPAGSSAAVLVGGPVYRSEDKRWVYRGGWELYAASTAGYRSAGENFRSTLHIPKLPGTSEEVDEINALLTKAGWSNTRYTGEAATEEQVRTVRRPRVLHIATHGFVLPYEESVRSMEEAVKAAEEIRVDTSLDIEDKATDLAPNIAKLEDPLLRAGLLLTGAENFRSLEIKPDGEDEILTAYDASLLDLRGTELVVLSACETGLGEMVPDEGLFGLRQGFAMAGARSVMVSLWHVDDAVTRELMAAFYRNWLGGQPKRAALRAAQQSISRNYPAPYYWGAFVLFGE